MCPDQQNENKKKLKKVWWFNYVTKVCLDNGIRANANLMALANVRLFFWHKKGKLERYSCEWDKSEKTDFDGNPAET